MITKKNCRQAVEALQKLRSMYVEYSQAVDEISGRDVTTQVQLMDELKLALESADELIDRRMWPESYLEPRRMSECKLKETYHENLFEQVYPHIQQLQVLPDHSILTMAKDGTLRYLRVYDDNIFAGLNFLFDSQDSFHQYEKNSLVAVNQPRGKPAELVDCYYNSDNNDINWHSRTISPMPDSGEVTQVRVVKAADHRDVIVSSSEGIRIYDLDSENDVGGQLFNEAVFTVDSTNRLLVVLPQGEVTELTRKENGWYLGNTSTVEAIATGQGPVSLERLKDGKVVVICRDGRVVILNSDLSFREILLTGGVKRCSRTQILPDESIVISLEEKLMRYRKMARNIDDWILDQNKPLLTTESSITDFQILPDGRIVVAQENGKVSIFDG